MAQLMRLQLIVSCFIKIQIGFNFLVPAHTGSSGQRAVKQVCVCMQEASRMLCINQKEETDRQRNRQADKR